MKIKSVAGLTCYVKNLASSVRFYEKLGFEIRKRDASHATAYSNWFWIDFILASKEARPDHQKLKGVATRGQGVLLFLSVEDVDGFHKYLLTKGLKPLGPPQDWPSGNREFLLRDPDGYNLAIFKRK